MILRVRYKGLEYKKNLEGEEDNPLYSDAVANEVLRRLDSVEKFDGVVDTAETAIMANLWAEHEFCKNRDSYRKFINEAENKISELCLILDSALE